MLRKKNAMRDSLPVSRDGERRCRLHGGLSTGLMTSEGLAALANNAGDVAATPEGVNVINWGD